MKKQIFNCAVGIIINNLTDMISGGFTTKKTYNSLLINFDYNHCSFCVEVQNENSENLLIFLNNRSIGTSLNVEEVLNYIKYQLYETANK